MFRKHAKIENYLEFKSNKPMSQFSSYVRANLIIVSMPRVSPTILLTEIGERNTDLSSNLSSTKGQEGRYLTLDLRFSSVLRDFLCSITAFLMGLSFGGRSGLREIPVSFRFFVAAIHSSLCDKSQNRMMIPESALRLRR